MRKITFGFLLLFSSFLQAQLQINTPAPATPTEILTNYLLSSGVTPLNVKFNNSTANATIVNDQCAPWSIGANPVNFGFTPGQKGALLTSGIVDIALGPNNTSSATFQTHKPLVGDADLAILANTSSIKNVAILEFDFVATGPKLTFDYVFGSEEYPEYAPPNNSTFNDAFGFFLSGPGITGPFSNNAKNIALIPGTNTGVSINTVNPSTNPTYYTNNPIGSPDTQYDGLTTVLQASHELKCGQTYHLKIAIGNVGDNAYDSGVFLRNCTIEQEACVDKIKMVAFIDNNNNGIKDYNEIYFNNGSFIYQKNNSGVSNSVVAPEGVYEIIDTNPANTYDFSYQINPELAAVYTATQSYNDISIPVGSGSTIYYLPIKLINGYNDAAVSIIPESQPRPGFSYINRIIYKNLGNTTTVGTLTFTKPTAATIEYVNQTGIENTANGFTFNYTNLGPNETRTILVRMIVPTIPTVNLGDILSCSAGVSAPVNDINLANNNFTINQTVVGSYDPNDITEAHGEKIAFGNFGADEYLTYTIRFQNTGTASAEKVRVENVLDAKLDPQSIRMVNASHNYVMERNNNNIVWRFDNINLPWANQNEEASNGYITFQIKLKPGFAEGDIVPSHADIYFDFNPAITTNTFNTEFVAQLGQASFASNNITLYPNPAKNQAQISLQDSSENLNSIAVYNILGSCVKSIHNLSSHQSSISVADLEKGIYMIEITTESQLKTTKKLIVE